MVDQVLTVAGLGVVLSRNGRKHRVLDDISFAVAPGEILAVVGESGAGKSTLGAAIQGLLPSDSAPEVSGSIRLAELEIVGSPPHLLRSARRLLVRAVPQDPMGAINPTMTIRRQLHESADGDETLILDSLRRAGLRDEKRIAGAFPHRLSGGERQRVLIAMAMMARPKLLIADEPTTALDVTTQAQLLQIVRNLAREEHTAIIYITHDLNVAAAVADRVMVLFGGRMAEIGTLREVARNPQHPYSASLFAARYDLTSDRSRPLPTKRTAFRRDETSERGCNYVLHCQIARPDCSSIRPRERRARSHSGLVACHRSDETPLPTIPVAASREAWAGEEVTDGPVALELLDVHKHFPADRQGVWERRRLIPALRGVNLSIALGQSVAVVGESGSGKSTLLKIAAGLMAADSGHVSCLDPRPQVIFQDSVSALTPWLSVGDQVGERLRPHVASAAERRRRVGEALQSVGLDPSLMHALPSELSVGQCQRAIVARAVVVPPKLLLCDEPISAMDVPLAAATLNLLNDLRRRLGLAMLFVTHDLAAARVIADRIVVLNKGTVVEEFEADMLQSPSRGAVTRALIEACPSLDAMLAR
ncbi:peptide/nickel transport system ATP-binding protein [Sinorhizobium terangae]|uniref:ATP-binding cassette domain-containing protein n=1 Tax=Sinorhizobium terangae TaxID=110322 RepID=A0A6N7LBM6_SINTE|nr:ABC transporter ATP-binding protein [Sinorhizobium terangae]MBB4188594.1 peptide/nickel transport system ATP-binding protein [Sinorhizobium terangae]MQX14599.1 ATP-binding cassette domain-containing protein [Sinorhizobium terangae]